MLRSTSQAAIAAGVSVSTIRNVTSGQFAEHYAGCFAAGATPGKGGQRLFTEDDVILLRYIKHRTSSGASHADVGGEARAGQHKSFVFPEEPEVITDREDKRAVEQDAGNASTPPQSTGAELLVLSQVVDLLKTEFAASRRHEKELEEQLREAERRAAVAEAQLDQLKAERRRGLLARLFGR